MSWIGGKKALRDVILQRFPLYYEKYIVIDPGDTRRKVAMALELLVAKRQLRPAKKHGLGPA